MLLFSEQLHLAATIFMTGVIWFVQIVHYPLMANVGAKESVAYAEAHQRRTTWVVAPAMLVEGATIPLLLILNPSNLYSALFIISACLLVVIWASTIFLQVPLHNKLARQADTSVVSNLVQSNWVRTIAWSLRALLVISALG